MNEMMIFNNEEFGEVRTVMIDGVPYFVGKDVAVALKYDDTNQAIRKHVEKEDKLTRQINGSGQKRTMIVINESGIYAMIFGSKLPSAKKFKHWVSSEVLPSLRKTGAYITENASEQVREMISTMAKEVVSSLKAEIKEEIKAELRSEFRTTETTARYQSERFYSSTVETPSPTYAIPQVFERLGMAKAREICHKYGATDFESLSCIYRRMNMLGVDMGVVRDRATAINPLTSSSVLKQIAVLPVYHDAFFKAVDDILNA